MSVTRRRPALLWRPGGRLSGGAVDPVTGIAQARHDVADLVQALIDSTGPDIHIGVGRVEGSDPLGCGQEAEEADRLGIPVARLGSTTITVRPSIGGNLQ